MLFQAAFFVRNGAGNDTLPGNRFRRSHLNRIGPAMPVGHIGIDEAAHRVVVRPRFVLNFIKKIVESIQLANQPADKLALNAHNSGAIGAGVQLLPILDFNALNVIDRIERMDTPLLVAVHGAEQCQFHHYTPTVCLTDEVLQSCQVLSIKPIEVESVSPSCISPLIAACPRGNDPSLGASVLRLMPNAPVAQL